ncbi:DUF4232 domain-containing protein [Streptomyces cucumeris]|uniref:DUF4232 domain-containing protein n=1 Tax=Streptomyces cucumeris TaxID=2962890 RepID=UPI0020C8D7CA|nr:DUF4232 domain-containing protein [Streptomyces sp. NEAU-Y11]MCP9207615.1 DUF4232 domain-containing protein [Streptomyces sp. NEAU-Y11]
MVQGHGATGARHTAMARSRPLVLSALLIGALATATGCGTDEGEGAWERSGGSGAAHAAESARAVESARAAESAAAPAPRERRSTPSADRTAAGPASASASASASGSGAAPSARRICSTERLKLTVGRKDVGAGNVYLPLVLTNASTSACTLTGFPGVSLLDADGALIGEPAARRGASHSTIPLPPGGSASALLHTLNEGVTDTPCWKSATSIRVYPPDSFRAMKVAAHSFRVCGGVFDVEAVRSGGGA